MTISFATFIEDAGDLHWAGVMAESLRTFGGRLKDSPIAVYLDENFPVSDDEVARALAKHKVVVKKSARPSEARAYILSAKVFAAARAESDCDSDILAWLDCDAIFTREPSAFLLGDTADLGYRPVQLVNISSKFDEPISPYWKRVFELLEVPDSAIFPMTTTVDNTCIRPQINAGMVIVRPKLGLLRAWADDFATLYSDPTMQAFCAEARLNNIYLHQAALTATILRQVPRDRMKDLPHTYNYAFFLWDIMAPGLRFQSLDEVDMLRLGPIYAGRDKLDSFGDRSDIYKWIMKRWPR